MIQSFTWGVHCEFQIQNYRKAVLSAPMLFLGANYGEKDLLARDAAVDKAKLTLEEHLAFLNRGQALDPQASLFVFGTRNSLVNLRAPILCKGTAHAVRGESPELSNRPYYGFGSREGRLSVGQALGGSAEEWSDFFVAGIPVLWDDMDEDTLLNQMLVEAADHSHILDLPRGKHPSATEETRRRWAELHAIFKATVHSDKSTAIAEMRSVVGPIDLELRRCDNYLNAVIGVTNDGAVILIYAHGRLEALGQRAKELGCRRAVCVENSGSVMPSYLPDGSAGPAIPLLRAPNFRSRGSAVVAIELTNPMYEAVPLSGRMGSCPAVVGT